MYINRLLEKEVIKYLERDEIIAIVGPRQAGKTTMIEYILSSIKNKNIKRISFDDVKDKQLFVNDIDSFIKKYIEGTDILFIDEIHYAKNSGKQLKYIFDKYKNIKLIISGSSAVDISIQSLKYLVGRVLVFKLFPFSFEEFIRSKDEKLYDIYLDNKYKEDILKELNGYLKEYILFGGYPKINLTNNTDEKKFILNNLYNLYALKEVKDLLNLSDDFSIHNLLKALSLQTAEIVNYSEIGNLSNLKYHKIKRILNFFDKTFICKEVPPYFTNKRNEIVKSKKIFFYDLGLRNIIIDDFKEDISGHLYENAIFCELIKNNIEVKYWHTKVGAEVDFIIEKSGNLILIEVKGDLKQPKITRSMNSFIERYSPKEAYILTLNLDEKVIKDNITINFIPYVKFILKIKDFK